MLLVGLRHGLQLELGRFLLSVVPFIDLGELSKANQKATYVCFNHLIKIIRFNSCINIRLKNFILILQL